MSYDYDCINNGWYNIAYGNGVFVAIDSSYNTSATSTCVISRIMVKRGHDTTCLMENGIILHTEMVFLLQ